MLKPLQPQSPQRIEWEQAVCHHIEIEAECTTGDAQGIMEAQSSTVDSLYLLRTVPVIAAMRLLRDSQPTDKGEAMRPTEQPNSGIAATCRAIQAGYAAGKSGMDDDMLPHLIDLGDQADEILALEQRAAELANALEEMTRTFLDGSHYDTQNPYTRPTVKAALQVLAKHKGMAPEGWMDAVKLEG